MYRVLIVDDEPLVQVGLKSMLQGMENVEVMGSASNGRDAYEMIESGRPDIVIADIKMPVMTGLELLEESHRHFGPVPAFIMLTAYEEFDMVRKALSFQAVDYLVKVELDKQQLSEAIKKAVVRIGQVKKPGVKGSEQSGQSADTVQLEELRQRFMLKLLHGEFTDEGALKHEAKNVRMDFKFNRYIAAYAEIVPESDDNKLSNVNEGYSATGFQVNEDKACDVNRNKEKSESQNESETNRIITLYRSCLSMTREIVERYAPCYLVSNDTEHFTILFFFTENTPVAESMNHIQEAVENAHTMINNYFNVSIRFGIGTAVSSPMDIHTTFEEARDAEKETDKDAAIRLFSHIVGANRRSGKDKLIAAIQDYIDENLKGKLQLNEIADAFGLSPAYLSVLFKKNTDIGFSEYVYTRKIEHAKKMLLSDDMKVYEVADALGFESAYYFSKVFKKVTGVSPREFIQAKTEG
ncbi:response regulator [Oribacterium sp. WCC10]|uniref:response regulator n=1 Tax=Oribacterium sp. WCC10 TaxID=1855343 RepID=UPI0008E8EB7F|nr:response regulator [Oribacterium sp. WCC10]SFG51067.1 two-component system, response regulator YesN [Oribacterium sp. WCC10]